MHSFGREPQRTCRLLAAAASLLRAIDPEDGSLAIELHDMARRLESLSGKPSTCDKPEAQLHDDTAPGKVVACGNAG